VHHTTPNKKAPKQGGFIKTENHFIIAIIFNQKIEQKEIDFYEPTFPAGS
jgi:hypothetical protein